MMVINSSLEPTLQKDAAVATYLCYYDKTALIYGESFEGV